MHQTLSTAPKLQMSNGASQKRYLFAWNTSGWARLYSPMARHLSKNYDIEIVLFTYGANLLPSRKLFGFNQEDFAAIIDIEPLLSARPRAELPDAAEIARQAQDVQSRLNINLLDVLRTDRHLGIDFVTGARFMRSKFGLSHNHSQNLDILLRLFSLFEELLLKYQPIGIMAWPGSIGPASLVALAEGMGIPMRALTLSRYGKAFHWMADQSAMPFGFHEAYERHVSIVMADAEIDRDESPVETPPPLRAKVAIGQFATNASVRYLIRTFYRYMRIQAGNYVHRRKKTYGNYLLLDWSRQLFERWRWRRRALRERPIMETLSPDLPFVFFPFHIEPESTMMVEAQMCDNQLTLLDWLAKAVPAGWYVIVKEHPGATAPRPAGFWQRVRRYPNVIIAATLENAESIAPRAKTVACITSSIGVQCALAGRPVITFHPKFIGLCMPHVLLATSYEATKAGLRAIQEDSLPDRATRLHAARSFMSALEECAFPIEDQGLQLGIPDETPIDAVDVERVVETLLATLGAAKEPTYT
jgi:hypothetical protein